MCEISQLYTEHRQNLVAYAVGYHRRSEMEAQDCVQDLFVLLMRKGLGIKLDEARNVGAWLRMNLGWVIGARNVRAGRQRRGGKSEHVGLDQCAEVPDAALLPDAEASRADVARVLEACGVTEATVIWKPGMEDAKRVALYRFRKKVREQVRAMLQLNEDDEFYRTLSH